MRYLITGGAGFIGSHLAELLMADGARIAVIDNFSTGSRDNLAAAAGPALELIEGDVVAEPELVRREVEKADAVFHLAAAVGVELVVSDPVRTIRTNVEGTENVLDAASRCRKRVIVASTSEVYGKSSAEVFRESDDLLIGSPEFSRWSYACSKLLDEFYLMAMHHMNGLAGTVVRFFNTVGPRQTGRYGMVVPRFVDRALRGEPLPVYGDGRQSRCFCHVKDVVRALRLLVAEPASCGQVYNIGSSRSTTIEELARLVIELTGSRSAIEYIPYEQAYEKGFEDMRRRMPDTTKIRDLIGWEPEYSLESIIEDVAGSLRAG